MPPRRKHESSDWQHCKNKAKRHKSDSYDRSETVSWKEGRWDANPRKRNAFEGHGGKHEKVPPWKHSRKEAKDRFRTSIDSSAHDYNRRSIGPSARSSARQLNGTDEMTRDGDASEASWRTPSPEDNEEVEESGIHEDDAIAEVSGHPEETDPPQIFTIFQDEVKVLEHHMKRIQRKSGARMEIDRRSSQVEIHGAPVSRERCVDLLMDEVSFLKNIDGVILKDQEPSEFDIRSEEVGQILGWNGEMLREIQNLSWARLQVDTSGRIKISGPPRARQRCQDLILDRVSFMADSTGTTLKNEAPGHIEEYPYAEDTQGIPRDIQILPYEVGQLLGSGGHRISRIQKESGGRLQVDKGRNRGRVQIFGSEDEKARCLELLLREITYAKDADGTILKDGRTEEGMPDFTEEDSDSSPLVIDVPRDEMGMLVGRRGENIKKWQKETGAHLNLIRGAGGKNTGRIEISGSRDARDSILTRMLATVSFAKQSDGTVLKDEPILYIWVKASEVSKVIGPHGTVMKQIMDTTGVDMRLKNANDMPRGSDEREIKLVGSEAQQKKAMEFILGQVTWARGADGVLKSKDDVEGEATSAYRLWIRECDASKVVGRGGKTLRDIWSKTGAHVKVQGRDEAPAESNEREIKIYGETEQQYQALDMILAEVSWARDDTGVLKNLEDQDGGLGPALTVWLDEKEARRVIGRNADQLRAIRNETGADIKISQEEDGCEREVQIFGEEEQKQEALEEILALVTWARGVDGIIKHVIKGGQGPDENTAIKLWVHGCEVGKIIGRGSEKIKSITNVSGARVKVQGASDGHDHARQKESEIWISGHAEQQSLALDLILAEVTWARDHYGVLKDESFAQEEEQSHGQIRHAEVQTQAAPKPSSAFGSLRKDVPFVPAALQRQHKMQDWNAETEE